MGKSATILLPPSLQDEEQRILARLQRGEHVEQCETKRHHKDGRLLDISLTVSLLKDDNGRAIGVSTIARDITSRKMINPLFIDDVVRAGPV
jgi:PAS domain S-box-containing protein